MDALAAGQQVAGHGAYRRFATGNGRTGMPRSMDEKKAPEGAFPGLLPTGFGR
jgi:hypothetical protein